MAILGVVAIAPSDGQSGSNANWAVSREADTVRDTQAVSGFRYGALKHTPFFHTINTIVAILRASVTSNRSGRPAVDTTRQEG
jgi:hypothetical protein